MVAQFGRARLPYMSLWQKSDWSSASLSGAVRCLARALRVTKSSPFGCESGRFAPSRRANSSRVTDPRLLPQALKGGSALAFVYGLDRHSTDLDFDADRRTDLSRRIRRGMQAAGVESTDWWFQDNKASLRFKVGYVGLAGDHSSVLQVDTRFKPKPIHAEVVSVKGVRTYTINALFRQKLDALGVRREPRDLYDLAFIARNYGNELDDGVIRQAEVQIRDMNRLERKFVRLFQRDEVIASLTTVDSVILELDDAINYQLRLRGMWAAEQRVPISPRMSKAIVWLRRQIHKSGPNYAGHGSLKRGQERAQAPSCTGDPE